MADLTFDGMLRVAFVPTIANIASPTVAELTAASVKDLTPRLSPDGLNVGADTASVDNNKMTSTFNTQLAGRRSLTASVTYVRGTDTTETAIEDALVYRATGYLVVRRDIAYSTAFAASQKVEVYPVQVGEANPAPPAPDTLQSVEVPLLITGDSRTITNRATVAV